MSNMEILVLVIGFLIWVMFVMFATAFMSTNSKLEERIRENELAMDNELEVLKELEALDKDGENFKRVTLKERE